MCKGPLSAAVLCEVQVHEVYSTVCYVGKRVNDKEQYIPQIREKYYLPVLLHRKGAADLFQVTDADTKYSSVTICVVTTRNCMISSFIVYSCYSNAEQTITKRSNRALLGKLQHSISILQSN